MEPRILTLTDEDGVPIEHRDEDGNLLWRRGEGEYGESPPQGTFSVNHGREFRGRAASISRTPDQSELERLAQQLRDHGTSLIYQQDDRQVDVTSLAMDMLGRSPLQTLPLDSNVTTVFTPLEGYLGSFVKISLEARPDHARKCEEDGRLWDLVAAYRYNIFETWRLGIIADNLEDSGYPSDDIRLVIMRKKPELWQMSWWPTCLRKDGDK